MNAKQLNSDPDKPGPTLVLHRRPLVTLKDKIVEQSSTWDIRNENEE